MESGKEGIRLARPGVRGALVFVLELGEVTDKPGVEVSTT